MKKVLVITYYWPPSGGGGVQRWLKFVKHLPEFGWESIIFTPENPDFSLQDDTLQKDINPNLEVIKFPIWEPFGVYKKLFKSSGKTVKQGIVIEKSKLTIGDKISIWIRANLFIPDPRVFWVRPSSKFLESIIKDNNIELVITTGPPHSMHLIGRRVKKTTGVKWIADFRDPWSEWDVLEKMKISPLAHQVHKHLEKKVMKDCDLLLTVSKRLSDSFISKKFAKNVLVVNNGVDEDDFKLSELPIYNSKFRIVHMGLLNEIRNPIALWEVLEELCIEEEGFKDKLEVVLAGMVSDSILDIISGSKELHGSLVYLDYLPHSEVFKQYSEASVLLLLLNQSENSKWILPGKMYEYMFAGRPILTLGNTESDVYDLLKDCEAGEVFGFDDKDKIKAFLIGAFHEFKQYKQAVRSDKVLNYTRRNLTKKLATYMNEIVDTKATSN